jgi:AcrR family transcriptional regulator
MYNTVIVTCMAPVKTHDASLATRLVDEAGRILRAEGIAALTLRKLATRSGTSTMAVYTLFGDKDGLLTAMHNEGFARLGAAMERAHRNGDDALTAMARLGEAYRDTALANPHLYNLMFGGAVPGFTPDAASQAAADATFSPLVEAVQRCLDEGALVGDDAERIATFLWSVTHGVVSLEISGKLWGDEVARQRVFGDAMVYSVLPFAPPS